MEEDNLGDKCFSMEEDDFGDNNREDVILHQDPFLNNGKKKSATHSDYKCKLSWFEFVV